VKLAAGLFCAATLIVACGSAPEQEADGPKTPANLPRGYARIDRMISRAEAQGLPVARVLVPLDAVPVAPVPPPLEPASAEGKPMVEDASLRDLGFFEVRATSSGIVGRSQDPFVLRSACDGPRRLLAIRGEGPVVDSARDGSLAYLLVDAVYDTGSCGTRLGPRRTTVQAKELMPNLLYAFRFVDPREPGVELLSLVLPTAGITTSRSRDVELRDDLHGDFSRVTLPIRPGSSESLLAQVAVDDATAWMHKLSPTEPAPVSHLLLGVELSQAGDDIPHQLLVYARRLPKKDERYEVE